MDERRRSKRQLELLLTEMQLASSLPPNPGREIARRRPRKRPKPPRTLMAAGIALVLLGLLAAVYQAVFAPSEEQAYSAAVSTVGSASLPQAEEPPLGAEEIQRIQLASRVRESKIPRPENSVMIELQPDCRAERERLLKSLEVNGQRAHFFPVSDLKLPPEGQPLRCYCLLSAPLDQLTEESWTKDGMFRNENEIVSPLLRYVVIDSQATRRNLDFALVDLLALSLAPEEK